MAEIPNTPDRTPEGAISPNAIPTPVLAVKDSETPAPETGTVGSQQRTLPTTAQKAMIAHYENDVASAMSQTDASQIQKFIERAKDEDALQKERTSQYKERALFTTIATLCIIGAIGAFVYAGLHYKSLTVPLVPTVSLGSFQSFGTKVSLATARDSMRTIALQDTAFTVGNAMLVDIVDNTGAFLSPKELFTYLDIAGTEPFTTSFVVARYGFVKVSDTEVVPFIIGATKDHSIAVKEFLIAEPTMTTLFAGAFMIDQKNIAAVVGGGFTQEIAANVPVRILRAQKDDQRQTTLVYGFPSDSIVVFSTDTRVFSVVENALGGE